MSFIVIGLVWLAFLASVFLFIGAILNFVENKGWTNYFEILVFIGIIFMVFIMGMVAFTGEFIINK